jgi:hypothetical protein
MPSTRLMISGSEYPGLVTVALQELAGTINNRRVWKQVGSKTAKIEDCMATINGMCRTEEEVIKDVDDFIDRTHRSMGDA